MRRRAPGPGVGVRGAQGAHSRRREGGKRAARCEKESHGRGVGGRGMGRCGRPKTVAGRSGHGWLGGDQAVTTGEGVCPSHLGKGCWGQTSRVLRAVGTCLSSETTVTRRLGRASSSVAPTRPGAPGARGVWGRGLCSNWKGRDWAGPGAGRPRGYPPNTPLLPPRPISRSAVPQVPVGGLGRVAVPLGGRQRGPRCGSEGEQLQGRARRPRSRRRELPRGTGLGLGREALEGEGKGPRLLWGRAALWLEVREGLRSLAPPPPAGPGKGLKASGSPPLPLLALAFIRGKFFQDTSLVLGPQVPSASVFCC